MLAPIGSPGTRLVALEQKPMWFPERLMLEQPLPPLAFDPLGVTEIFAAVLAVRS